MKIILFVSCYDINAGTECMLTICVVYEVTKVYCVV